jgi:hypothetical protein
MAALELLLKIELCGAASMAVAVQGPSSCDTAY